MATDIFLWTVPSDTNPNDVRLRDPTRAGTAAYVLNVDAGSYSITGAPARLLASRQLNAGAGSYAISGKATGLLASRVLAAAPGAYVVTGNAVTFVYTPVGPTGPGRIAFPPQVITSADVPRVSTVARPRRRS